jgi:gliding motility-associated-like protein
MKRIIIYSISLLSFCFSFAQQGVESLIHNGGFEQLASGGSYPTGGSKGDYISLESCDYWNNVARGGPGSDWTADWLGGPNWPIDNWVETHAGEMALGLVVSNSSPEGAWQQLTSAVSQGDLVVVSFWYKRSDTDELIKYIDAEVDIEIVFADNEPFINSSGGFHWKNGVSQEIQKIESISTPNDTEWHYYESVYITVEGDFSNFAIGTFPTGGNRGQQYFSIDDVTVERINLCEYCPTTVGAVDVFGDSNIEEESGSVINSGNSSWTGSQNVTWTAEDYISLQPGFTASSSGTTVFNAEIGEVANFCPTLSGGMNIDFIPNVITPNGDGANDTWRPQSIGNSYFNAYYYRLEVYDRWGVLRYSDIQSTVFPGFKEDEISWNGKETNGNLLNDDTYYLHLYLGNCDSKEKYSWKGWVQVIGGSSSRTGLIEETVNEFMDEGVVNEYLYPNPTTRLVNLPQIETIHQVLVYNRSGILVYEQSGELSTMDLSTLQPGIYMVQLVKDSGTEVQKIVIQR